MTGLYTAAGSAITASIFIPEPLTRMGSLLVGTVGGKTVLQRIEKVNSIRRTGHALNEAFKERGLQISVDLPVPDHGRLDLLLKFPLPPKKAMFAVAMRSQGKAKVFYNEAKGALYIRRGEAGLKRWNPDHIERLGMQGFWLRQNRQEELFGTSRNDRNRPIVKLLVLTGQTTLGKHSDNLYTQVGDQRVLLLRRQSSVYIMEENQLLPFLQAWLAPSEQ
ncbi:MAG: hypothetical protein HC895_03660 [Leptolyngbyaceae cyanobacterium SM1_3_5]|nr:hypothetical protein [Leptolyngbyaceae cyanobacterium SM1_3_5]